MAKKATVAKEEAKPRALFMLWGHKGVRTPKGSLVLAILRPDPTHCQHILARYDGRRGRNLLLTPKDLFGEDFGQQQIEMRGEIVGRVTDCSMAL